MCYKCYADRSSFSLLLLENNTMIIQAIKNLFGGSPKIDAKELVKNGYLVDVRSAAEFANGHVKGSVNIPMDSLSKNMKLLKTKQPIVIFCQSGMRAGMAKAMMNKNGIDQVTNVGGWQKLKRDLES